MKQAQGKFIVIEGTDGSGKTTQLKCLLNECEKLGISTHTLDFPQYDSFWGKVIGKFLNGNFGELEEISPYLIQPYFMLDQATQAENIRSALANKKTVLSNRYITSSMAHQASKMHTEAESWEFVDWLHEAGYKQLKMPKPDLVIVLYLPPEISTKRAQAEQGKKHLYSKQGDIAEDNLNHQLDSAAMYQKLCKKFPEWQMIDCTNAKGSQLSIEKTQELVQAKIKSYFA